MKVFMNANGKYLRLWRAEKGGFASGSHWVYQWVELNSATLAEYIPSGIGCSWRDGRSPAKEVIAELNFNEALKNVKPWK